MKKKMLLKKEQISKLNQFTLVGGGKTMSTGDSGLDPSDHTGPTAFNCNTNEQTCVACVSVHQSMCMIGATRC